MLRTSLPSLLAVLIGMTSGSVLAADGAWSERSATLADAGRHRLAVGCAVRALHTSGSDEAAEVARQRIRAMGVDSRRQAQYLDELLKADLHLQARRALEVARSTSARWRLKLADGRPLPPEGDTQSRVVLVVDGETLEAHASALRRALQEAGRSGQSLTVLLPTSAESALPDGIPATRVSRASYEEIRKRLKEQALPLAVVVNPSGKALAVVRDAGASFAQVALYAARLLTASGGASR